jgi:hypothetical protein
VRLRRALSDAALTDQIRAAIEASPFTGGGTGELVARARRTYARARTFTCTGVGAPVGGRRAQTAPPS